MSRRSIPPGAEAAVEKFREFHRLEPTKIGTFPSGFAIPKQIYRAGKAMFVLYRSGKVDPESLRRPKRPVDYIHEHDAGVTTYTAEAQDDGSERVEVPARYREVTALARLGQCLGFAWRDASGAEREAQCTTTGGLPELYTIEDGRCLLVIQSKKKVLAMMWGGGLGVFARGIDG